MASARIPRLQAPAPSNTRLLDDHRFRALLADEDWGRLPVAIWRRFSKRLEDGRTVIYVGEVDEASVSRIGWWFAQVARVIGGPLHSAKRFAGPTGLEEYIGFGIAMALRLCVADQALHFHSTGYSLQIGGLRLSPPEWLTPGDLTVTHSDLGDGEFRFTLDLIHPRFGRLIHQSARFTEAAS
jgi:Domain of unknown function (DUF4166)